MSAPTALYQWQQTLQRHLPHLSKPQASVLALWSLGMVLARSCGQTSVVSVLAGVLAAKPDALRQRLREFYYAKPDKAGAKRQEMEVSTCFAPLLAWVLSWWQAKQIALAVDATTLGNRFYVLCVSVLYRGCAIPVAWTVLQAEQKHAWRKEWLRMLRQVRTDLPQKTCVIVLADRGLYARWLFGRIVRLGWHPLLRVNNDGGFRPKGKSGFLPLWTYAPRPGTAWAGSGTAFSTPNRGLECTLLACWQEGCRDPWLLLTDLPPEAAHACWYGLRAWIEAGFKVIKRAGWQWHKTRMSDPARVERLWLCVAVATLWLLSVGGEADSAQAEATLPDLPVRSVRSHAGRHLRLVSVFRQGWVRLISALLNQQAFPQGRFVPEPWPRSLREVRAAQPPPKTLKQRAA